MPATLDEIARVYRDFETLGLPSSGEHHPIKRDIRALLADILASIGNGGTNLSPSFQAQVAALVNRMDTLDATAAAVDADRVASQDASATAQADAEQAAISRSAADVAADQAIAAAGATGNFTPFDTYALAVAGAGPLANGAIVHVWVDETHDDHHTVYVKESGVLDYKADLDLPAARLAIFDTRAQALAAFIPSATDTIALRGFALGGDGGESLWRRSASEPSHPGKFMSADGSWWQYASENVNAEALGVIPDNTLTDFSSEVQDCFDLARALQKVLIFPSGPICCDTAIDVTDMFGGTLEVIGTGPTIPNTLNGTVFIGNTGGVLFDTTGSQHVIFRDFSIDCVTLNPPNPSTIGILEARSTTSLYAQFNDKSGLTIRMDTDMSANGGTGTYGILNIAAEIQAVDKLWCIADNPYAMYGQKPAWLASPFRTITTSIISLSVLNFGIITCTGLSATRPLFKASLAKAVNIAMFHGAGLGTGAFDFEGVDGFACQGGSLEGANHVVGADVFNCSNIYIMLYSPAGFSPDYAIRMRNSFGYIVGLTLRIGFKATWDNVIYCENPTSVVRQVTLRITDDDAIVPTTNVFAPTSIDRLPASGGWLRPDLNRPVVGGYLKHTPTPVSGLPAAATAGLGAEAFVSDATAPVKGNVVAGGGSTPTAVYSTGAAWIVG